MVAFGQTAVYGALRQFGDADNGFALVEFANGKILTSHLGRTLTNGHESTTRVFGTKGSAIINGVDVELIALYASRSDLMVLDYGFQSSTSS